jgi:hypothetical protein
VSHEHWFVRLVKILTKEKTRSSSVEYGVYGGYIFESTINLQDICRDISIDIFDRHTMGVLDSNVSMSRFKDSLNLFFSTVVHSVEQPMFHHIRCQSYGITNKMSIVFAEDVS